MNENFKAGDPGVCKTDAVKKLFGATEVVQREYVKTEIGRDASGSFYGLVTVDNLSPFPNVYSTITFETEPCMNRATAEHEARRLARERGLR